MTNFEKRFRAGSRVGLFAGVGTLIAIMLLIVANVIGRALLGRAVQAAWEVSGLMLVIVAVFSMLYAVLEKSNVRVDIVVSRLRQRTQEIIEMFTSVISMGVMVFILWVTVDWLAGGAFRGKTGIGVPHLPFQIIWVFGLLVICLALVLYAYKALRKR